MADSAAQARVEYERKQPDVIIADIGMPDEDGYALLEKIRGLERHLKCTRVPAIALTASPGARIVSTRWQLDLMSI